MGNRYKLESVLGEPALNPPDYHLQLYLYYAAAGSQCRAVKAVMRLFIAAAANRGQRTPGVPAAVKGFTILNPDYMSRKKSFIHFRHQPAKKPPD